MDFATWSRDQPFAFIQSLSMVPSYAGCNELASPKLHGELTTSRWPRATFYPMRNKANPKLGMQPIPLHLKGWRVHRTLSQERLAEMIGTTKATISRIENRKQNWDQAFLQAAADALRCEPRDLMIRDPSQPNALWTIYDQLSAPEREQAIRLITALHDTRGETGT